VRETSEDYLIIPHVVGIIQVGFTGIALPTVLLGEVIFIRDFTAFAVRAHSYSLAFYSA